MSHRYTGLSAQQVEAQRQKYGANVITPPSPPRLMDKVSQATTCWLVKGMLIANIFLIVLILIIDIVITNMPYSVWYISLVFIVLLGLVFFITMINGRWNATKQRMEIDPLISILMIALAFSGIVAFYQSVFGGEEGIQPYLEPLGIALAILLATSITYVLERKNEKTFRALNVMNDEDLVKVIRDSHVTQVPRREIVVGDIILLEAGDEVPADAELLDSLDLVVNESSLTGEPECEKTVNLADRDLEAPFPSNYVMRSSIVLEGEGVARVFAVGNMTDAANTMKISSTVDETPLQQQLRKLAKTITRISYVVAGLIVVGRLTIYLVQGDMLLIATTGWVSLIKYLLDTIMIAVTLLVVTVPEGLPMAVTLCLAFSMRRLMKHNTLPRTMHACETMGATTIICTDKTGTLTQNQMRVHDALLVGDSGQDKRNENRLWQSIALNTTANLDIVDENNPQVIGNPTEGALLLWMYEQGHSYVQYRQEAKILQRLPFSTERKYMATIAQLPNGKRMLYVKGASYVLLQYSIMANDAQQQYLEQLNLFQEHAYRTLGFAYKEVEIDEKVWDEHGLIVNDLTMLGIVAIADPIRKDVSQAIRNCIRAGIEVMIITGDAPGTTKEIAKQLGLWQTSDDEEAVLVGWRMEYMTDEELKERLPKVKVVARARPSDKERIVGLLRQMGHVVAVTGDGTNDAPALNAANIGLSMGDGTAIAKEASDMIIMDNSFTTISNAVMWGRSLYKNIQRFILFQLTVNVVACLIVMIGAFTGTDSPLTVMQMLWVNLILDTFAALALSSLPPYTRTMQEKPRKVDEPILHGLEKRILAVGVVMSATLLCMWIVFQHTHITSLLHADWQWGKYNGLSPYEYGLFFTTFVMLQFWNLFNVRAFMTKRSAFYGLSMRRTPWFICIVLLIFIGQIMIVELPYVQTMFSIPQGGLLLADWLIIIAVTSLVLWAGEIQRYWQKRKKNSR